MDTQSSGARILILGGYGRVGQEAARYLLNATDAKVALSSRTARPLPVWAGPSSLDRLTNQQLDVFDGEALFAACARSDLVISCAGPSGLIGERVAVACKRAGVPLVDAGGYDPLLHSLQQAQATEPTSVPLVINVGLLPGLSGLFPKWLLDTQRDTQLVEALDVYYVGRDAWTYNSAWDIINSLGGFGHDRGFCYLNGQNVVRVPMRKAARKVNFPDPIGSASTMLIYSEEISRLACQWEIDTARVYGANIGPRATLVCMLAKVLRFYQTPRAVARGARWLARASARDMQKLEPAYGIHVDLHYRGGRTASATLTLDDTYRATGTVIGIAAHQLLDEGGPGPGIFMLHEAVQSERFMHSLEAQGLLRIFHGAQDSGNRLEGATV
ncbi:saccharopine dehydrogenase NADP-binding domain-containing protein [Pseudomonas aeruginosa]|uniref:saccharopine dehydrogenase NADP-binding domain-containing protein n=1 Tax=Pseudomonas aeruginosa TaxID=287 RepID=UPI000EACA530|nr:saccharopine dehydrogenase NADP-binding domain-containing protein [Pseudomonas aeruginosa]